jgi:hypothetical protein
MASGVAKRPRRDRGCFRFEARPHEALEKLVTGSAAAKAQGAAVRTVGSRQAGAVIADVSGNASEVTLAESDGSRVEV